MKKTVYQLLNDVETDYTEYERTEMSFEEKEYYKQKILMEVKNMKKNERKLNRRMWLKGAGIAAALAAAIGVAGVASQPVLAEQLFSNTFGKIFEGMQGEIGFFGQKELYTKIAANVVPVQEELDKRQDADSYTTVAEDNGVTFSVSDVYCDGSTLYYTLTLKTEREDLNQAERIVVLSIDEETAIENLDNAKIIGSDGKNIATGGLLSYLKKVEDGLFVAVEEVELYSGDGARDGRIKEELQKMDESGGIVANQEVGKFMGVLMDENGGETEIASVEGNWDLKFPVTINSLDSETITVNQENNDVQLKEIVKTKTDIKISINYQDARLIERMVTIAVKDTDGNYLQCLGGGGGLSLEGRGYHHTEEFLYDGQKDLIVEVIADDENGNDETVAEFVVQMP